MVNVVGGKTENYDREQLEKAIRRAVMANRTPIGDAEIRVQQVVERIEHWLADKTEVTDHELRLQTAVVLGDYDTDAADYYLTEEKLF